MVTILKTCVNATASVKLISLFKSSLMFLQGAGRTQLLLHSEQLKFKSMLHYIVSALLISCAPSLQ